MSNLIALRFGLILAGVIFNEVNRHKKDRRQRRRRHVVKYKKREDDVDSENDSEDEYWHPTRSITYPHHDHGTGQPRYGGPREKRPRDQGIWLLDTGATQHSCSDYRLFSTYTPAFGLAKGIGKEVLAVRGTGTVHLNVLVDGLPRILALENVAHIPEQECEHLLAFDPFLQTGGRLWTEGWSTYVANREGVVLLQCSRVNSACQVELDLNPEMTRMVLQKRREMAKARMEVPHGW